MVQVASLALVLLTASPPPVLHLVIDDVGLREEALDPFFEIAGLAPFVTWAVLPTAEFARQAARKVVAAGGTLFIHVPMEPDDAEQMTPTLGSYLEVADPHSRIKNKLSRALTTLPVSLRKYIRGINNHQGSRFTTSRPAMDAIMEVLKRRRLCFLDSRTSAQTVGRLAAKRGGVPVVERDVFLDNKRTVAAIKTQLDEALKVARSRGRAIAIGHPYAQTAEAIGDWLVEHPDVVLEPLCPKPDKAARGTPNRRPGNRVKLP